MVPGSLDWNTFPLIGHFRFAKVMIGPTAPLLFLGAHHLRREPSKDVAHRGELILHGMAVVLVHALRSYYAPQVLGEDYHDTDWQSMLQDTITFGSVSRCSIHQFLTPEISLSLFHMNTLLTDLF